MRATAQTVAAPDAAASAPVANLETVVVRASADASAGGLKPPYAGGQVARGGRVGILGSQDIMDTPFSITNYTQALIQDQQAASIADVLQNDPAVRVARGFGNYQQLYMVRGLPVYSDDMSYNGLYGLLPRQYLAAELVERVEVLHGASAFLNGAAPGGSGLGGAINVMPKRAPNEALNEVTLGVESGGQGYAAADIARRFGTDQALGVRLNAVRRDGGTAVDGEKRRLSLASVGLDYHTGDLRVSADLGYQDHKLENTQPSVTFGAGVPILSAPEARRSLAQPWTHSYEEDTFGTLRAEYDLAKNVTVWGAYGQRHGDEDTDLANPTVTDNAGSMTSYRFVGTRADRISTGEIGVRATLQTGPVGHTLIASAATYHAKTSAPYAFSDFGPDFLGTIKSNLYTPTVTAPPAATRADRRDRLRHQDLERRDRRHAVDARQEPCSSRSAHATRRSRAARTTRAASRRSPAWSTSSARWVSVYGSYVEGLVRAIRRRPPAAPRRSSTAGEGLQALPDQAGRDRREARHRPLRRQLQRLQLAQAHLLGGHDDLRFGQTGEQRNRGAELSFFGEAAPGLKLLGGASWLDARVGDFDAIGAPKTQLNVEADWGVPGLRGFSLNGRAVYTSSQYADAANTQVVPSWTRLDVGARYELPIGTQTLTIRGRIDNLTNRNDWVSAGGYPGAGYLTLSTPRTFVLSGTLSF